jgi:hypothetical protein
MNCKQYQEKILESLASGAGLFPGEVTAHRQACPVCRGFHEQQASVFRSIDAGLRAMANQEVPPSLVPGLRARLDQEHPPRRAWIPGWSFAVTVVAVGVLAVGIAYVRRPPESRPNSSGSGPMVSRGAGNPAPVVQPPSKTVGGLPSRTHKGVSSSAPLPSRSEAAPEVIVLAEERQAFVKFVAELPEERDVALALTRPAPPEADVPVEIALLQIESLEVKPLEETPRE